MVFRRLTLRGKLLYIGTVVLITLAIAGIGFVWWASHSAEPMAEALAALRSDETVTVDYAVWLTFTPTAQPPTEGFIFYPGGRVDPRAYAPAAHAVAAAGYLVVIVPMPLNLAVFAPNRAEEVIAAYPTIDRWAIGGHSLGGTMAAGFVAKHPGAVDTLILWAAYPAGNASLADRADLHVTSIYGTNDGLATTSDIDNSRALLPPTTTFVPIEGGNHGQFGWYGEQPGDNPATISRTAQQAITVEATVRQLAVDSGQ